MCLSFHQSAQEYSFWLPTHKTNTTFEGNKIVVRKISGAPDPLLIMIRYIKSCDTLFPFHPQLWLKADGTTPLRSWFISHLHHYFGTDIAGQSMRSGGATAMAEAGAVPELIKGAGRWSSTAFERYIRKNLVMLHALILSRSSHYDTNITLVIYCTSHSSPSHVLISFLGHFSSKQKQKQKNPFLPFDRILALSHALYKFKSPSGFRAGELLYWLTTAHPH